MSGKDKRTTGMSPERWLLLLTVLMAVGLLGINWLPRGTRDGWSEKLAAAEMSQQAMEKVKAAALEQGVTVDLNTDPWSTTLIGVEYTELTTTLGNLAVKQLSLNPNFAAVVVEQLMDAGVKAGDKAAIHFSGSFPALNISVLAACHVLETQPVIISSIGASNWGANRREWTWMEMEQVLIQQRGSNTGSKAYSLGGQGDLGREMPADLKAEIRLRAQAYDVPLLVTEELEEQVREKWNLYSQGKTPAVFINVGGNATVYGSSEHVGNLIPGLQDPGFASQWPAETSLMSLFDAAGIPVIHLLNLRSLAVQYDLGAMDEKPSLPGEGGVYSNILWIRVYGGFWLIMGMTGLWWIREKGGDHHGGTTH